MSDPTTSREPADEGIDKLGYEPPDAERAASAAPTESELERELPGGRQAAAHNPYAAWKHATFRLLIIGWWFALIGGHMQAAAIAWEIFKHTGRAIDLGWLGLVQALPVILLA